MFLIMLSVLLLFFTLILAAHKVRAHRTRFGIVAIPIFGQVDSATSAADAVVKVSALTNFTSDFFAVAVDMNFTARDGTVGEGPIQVGVAHGDYTVAEIQEQLQAELNDPGNKILAEQSRRLVRKAGMFPMIAADEVMNNGRKFRIKLRFRISNGHTLAVWARNRSGAQLTNGPFVQFDGTIYGRWI